jgi:hypothetical protein
MSLSDIKVLLRYGEIWREWIVWKEEREVSGRLANSATLLKLFVGFNMSKLLQSKSLQTGRSGTECWRGRDFPHPSRPALGPTQPHIKWAPSLFPRGKAAGVWRWPPTPSSAEVKERVEQHLFNLCGPSWPVLGRTYYRQNARCVAIEGHELPCSEQLSAFSFLTLGILNVLCYRKVLLLHNSLAQSFG